jgi:hypothetical protein
MVDGHEQATLVPELMWSLGNEATPEVRAFDPVRGLFAGAHAGYLRLANGVRVVRTIELDGDRHRLTVHDEFEGDGEHEVSVPLQLSERSVIEAAGDTTVVVVDGKRFAITFDDAAEWALSTESAWVSPSYRVKREAPRLRWHRTGPLRPLRVQVAPL